MQRDIRRALPNSIRISPDQTTLEFLQLVDGGRYRAIVDNTQIPPTGDILNFDATDTSFDVLAGLNNLADISLGNDLVVIYPLDSTGNNAYAGDNTSTVTAVTTNSITFDSFLFPLRSPSQRFFIIEDSPVTYRCNTTPAEPNNKTLLRYTAYPIQAFQPLIPSSLPAIQANQIAACRFSYNSGSSTRSAVVKIELTLTDEANESINLIHQVHLDNAP
jgi:MSHA biogenesis protein MshO